MLLTYFMKTNKKEQLGHSSYNKKNVIENIKNDIRCI